MSALRASSIAELLNASSDDEDVLQFAIPDAAFGYHAQQAVEKLYTALLSALGQKYAFTHDLFALRKHLEQNGEVLPNFVPKLEHFTSFAGQFRYEQPIHLDDPQRLEVRAWIELLRIFSLERIEDHGLLPMRQADRWI
jgi:hypothetical protein